MKATKEDRIDVWAGRDGGQLVVLTEGRDLYQVYDDEHMLGNSRVAPCSKQLKQLPARRWVEANYQPGEVTIYVGIDWTELHRVGPNKEGWAPYQCEAPLTQPPYLDSDKINQQLQDLGIRPPRLYELGFTHANCGGFCCRMGHKQAKLLLNTFPNRYDYHEQQEEAFRQKFGKDVAFMRDRRGGVTKPLTLRQFRERQEASPDEPVPDDTPGCAQCFLYNKEDATGEAPIPAGEDGAHVVQFSSGRTSWATARRVREQHGVERLTLLFSDVKGSDPTNPHAGEDSDNYRFLHEAAADVLGPLRLVHKEMVSA